jgi:CheY-like chemotaxis protein
VGSPGEALAALRTQTPELIVLDMNFSIETSGEEGWACCNRSGNSGPTCP